MAEQKLVTVRLRVDPKEGYSFQAWVDANHQDLQAREVVVVDEKKRLVDVSYLAISANKEDIMRPYRLRGKWTRMADVTIE